MNWAMLWAKIRKLEQNSGGGSSGGGISVLNLADYGIDVLGMYMGGKPKATVDGTGLFDDMMAAVNAKMLPVAYEANTGNYVTLNCFRDAFAVCSIEMWTISDTVTITTLKLAFSKGSDKTDVYMVPA